jgi:hypothetical protein
VIDALRHALQPMIRSANTCWLEYMRQEAEKMNARKRREATG